MAPKTKILGTKTALWVIAALTELDIVIAETPGDHLRYDLVILLDDGTYRRVQVKHAREDKSLGCLQFSTCSNNSCGDTTIKNDYRGQAELFGTYFEVTQKAYLIPVNSVGVSNAMLRIKPTANNQAKGVRWATDYEVTLANKPAIMKMIVDSSFNDTRPSI